MPTATRILSWLTLAAGLLTAPLVWAQTPTLTGRTPAANANNAPLAAPITATFSQPLNPATAGGVRVQGSLRQGRRAGTATASGSTLSFQPTVPLLPGEQVQVTLPGTVKGANGAAIAPQVYQLRAATGGPGSGKYLAGPITSFGAGNLDSRENLLGDLDNDGDLDALSLEYAFQPLTYNLRVLRNQGGALVAEPAASLPASATIYDNSLADFDGDGDLDLLVERQNQGTATAYYSIFFNDGGGNFMATPARLIYQKDFRFRPSPADLDGDGDLDLLVLDYDATMQTTTMMTYVNDGSANFTLQSPGILTSSDIGSTVGAVGDVDEDGDLDVLSYHASGSTATLMLFRNQGNGLMAAPVTTSLTDTSLKPFQLLDLNGDHHLDVVYYRYLTPSTREMWVAFGNGAGDVGPAALLPGTGPHFGDVDGDGDLDYTYISNNHQDLTTVLNDGQGSFAAAFNLPMSAFLSMGDLGDLDGDGDLDALLVLDGAGGSLAVQLLTNESARPVISSFSPAQGVAGTSITIAGDNLASVSSVKLNGLALPITATAAISLTVTLPVGAASGPLTVTNTYGPTTSATSFVVRLGVTSTSPAPNAVGQGPNSPVTATFTEPVAAGSTAGIKVTGSVRGSFGATVSGGGSATLSLSLSTTPVAGEKLTVALPSSIQTATGAALLPYTWSFISGTGGTGTGNFQPGYSTLSPGTNGPKAVLTADLNHDGYPDLVALQPDAPDENVLVALNTGTGTLGTPTLLPIGPQNSALALADVNQDGHLDLLTTSRTFNNNTYQYTGYLNVRLGNGNGGFSSTATSITAGGWLIALAVGDVNGDGLADVVAADYNSSSLITFLGGAIGLGAGIAAGSVDAGPTDVALADVNNDGKLDALAAPLFVGNSSTPGRVSVRLGTGSGTFGGSGFITASAQTSALTVGDLNGDHFVDVISMANSSGGGPVNTVQLALGAGDGSFTVSQNLPLSGQPYSGTLGDIDADGDLDVVVANGSQIKVLRNDGGTLVARPDAAAGSSPQNPALADLDGDGDLDLAVANYGSGYLTVRFNLPGPPPPPTISSFTPGSGGPNTTVTVNGTAFNNTSSVKFNGMAGNNVVINSNFQLTVEVPYGATTGPISVTTPGGTATSASNFTVVQPPVISSFSPTTGPVGTVVTVLGSNFTGLTAVNFNAIAATTFTIDSDTQLRVTVPAGVTSSYIQVTGPGGQAGSAQQFNVSGLPPVINGFGPTSGGAGTIVSVYGSGFGTSPSVSFNGTAATTFIGSPTNSYFSVQVPVGATTGKITVNTASGTATSANDFTITPPLPPPAPANDLCTSTSLPVLQCGQQFVAGSTVGATSTGDPTTGLNGLTPSTAAGGVFYQFLGNGESVTVDLCASTYVPWGARLFVYTGTCGNMTCVAADASSCSNGFPKVTFTALSNTTYYIYVNGAGSGQGNFLIGTSCDLTVSYNQIIPAGSYQNLFITNLATGTLGGPVAVQNQLQVQPGGTLLTACQALTGSGSFSLGSGATLGICDANGLGLPGSGLGAVQLSGAFTLSPEARYLYNGTAPQQAGAGLPAQAQALLLSNAAGLSLNKEVNISQLVRLTSGDLNLNGQYLTLLSSASGTALIDNTGGKVLGSTGQMQRWIDPSINAGTGYRHFSAPVSGNSVGQLTTTGYTPVVNSAYNTSATPGSISPFPTIFGYDESRLSTASSNYAAFDKGWYSPAALTDVLTPGRGYTVQLPPSALCTFQGTFTTDSLQVLLTRGPQADAGWQLLGNPYPSPIDWDAPGGLRRKNLDNALYICQSLSAYTGKYQSYVNGMGPAGYNLIAAGQSFFVRVSQGQTAGAFTFKNAARLTEFTGPGQPQLHRQTSSDLRPRLALRLAAAGTTSASLQDETYVYFEAGATAGPDATYDATKLWNTGSAVNLATALGGTAYAINGLPPLAAPTVLPLTLYVPQPGTYSFETSQLESFAPGQTVTLRDALLNTRTPLSLTTQYTFTLAGTDAPGRFSLEFAPATALAATSGTAPASWQIFPNPTHDGKLRLVLPLPKPLAATAPCTAELRDALGRVVRPLPLARPVAALLDQTLDVSGLATGVYLLHLRVGEQSLVRRVVLE